MPKIHNHYVPRFYLKGFAEEPPSEMMFAYQRGSKAPFHTQVKNLANEVGLYSDELETVLANDIEQSANPILQKLRGFQPISEDEKLEFSRYMFSMRLRVPKHLDWTFERAPEVMSKTISKIERQLLEFAEKHPDKRQLVDQRIRQLHDTPINDTEESIKEMWMKNVPVGIDRPPVQTLADMEWRYLYYEGDQFFITSDNPLFFFEALGIGNEKSEVTFPLAKNIVLWAKWRTDIPPGFHRARTQFVKEVNRRTISNASKYIFSPYAADWIPTLLAKDTIRLNRVL